MGPIQRHPFKRATVALATDQPPADQHRRAPPWLGGGGAPAAAPLSRNTRRRHYPGTMPPRTEYGDQLAAHLPSSRGGQHRVDVPRMPVQNAFPARRVDVCSKGRGKEEQDALLLAIVQLGGRNASEEDRCLRSWLC